MPSVESGEVAEDSARLVDVADEVADVVVLGGGLAGLSLALQLRRADPGLSVVVAERRAYRPRSAAFKVGESTSEVGAHYFANVLGLGEYLREAQVRKNGLRFFFSAGGNRDIAERVEFGTPLHPQIATYQLDRGLLENRLWDLNREQGSVVLRGCRVEEADLSAQGHRVVLAQGEERREVRARWVVDASGRTALLRSKLGLHRPVEHTVNAAWLRLEGGLDLEEWSSDEAWLGRMDARGMRRFATNHLAGQGYWVWLIQLASGPVSVGVCADPRFHPFGRIASLDAFVDWLGEHEPQLAATIDSRREQVMDFLTVEDFAYGTGQMYSPDRWCLTGEAGFFTDPLFSPGSDFIAMGNTYITDLVVRDHRGEAVEERREFYDFFIQELYRGYLTAHTGQYALYGNTQVMVAKLTFDTLLYWTLLCQWSLHDTLTDLDTFTALLPEVDVPELMARAQRLFREWHELEPRRWQDALVPLGDFQPLVDRQVDMATPRDADALSARISESFDVVLCLLVALFHKALELLPDQHIDPQAPIQPLAVGLDPTRWDDDGLLDDGGISLADALERLPGLEAIWLDRYAEPAAGAV